MNKLNIRLLGNVEICFNGKFLNETLSSKSVGIIAILLSDVDKKFLREKLSYMLWPDCFETANYNLRYNLWNIKKSIPNDDNNQEFVIADNKYCYINPEYKFNCDITFLKNVNLKGQDNEVIVLKDVIKQFRGEFLENVYIKECDEFNDWIFSQRTLFQTMEIEALNALLDIYLKLEDYQNAKKILEEVLKLNPYDEDSHYKLMKLFINNNESNLAILHYKKYETILREDLNIFPQEKIKELYASLVDSENNREIAFKKEEKGVIIKVNEHPEKLIEYFVVSDFIGKLLSNFKKDIIQNIPKIFLEDVCTIQPSIYEYINSEYSSSNAIKEIRLFHSFKSIIQYLGNESYIQVIVYNKDKMDDESYRFLRLIENTTNIHIKYLKNEY